MWSATDDKWGDGSVLLLNGLGDSILIPSCCILLNTGKCVLIPLTD